MNKINYNEKKALNYRKINQLYPDKFQYNK